MECGQHPQLIIRLSGNSSFIYGDDRHMSQDGRGSQRAQPAVQLPGVISALAVGEKLIWEEIGRSQT